MSFTTRETQAIIHCIIKTQITTTKEEKMITTLLNIRKRKMREKEERCHGEQATQIRFKQPIK
jgi:hypothetical protein